MKPLSATEAVAAIEAGTLTAEKLVRDCLDRIAEREPVVKAWAFLDPALAIAQAKAADAARGGVLRGVPIGVKDIIDTHDMPTGHNSPIFEGKVPFGDAACVALCRTANAVIMGKTVTTEFANRHPGPTTNPHNPGHTPGGSSSGSAAAVADGHVPLAFGTQTGGSVIRPAAYCGVIGYKPTFGDFSRVGIKMQCHSLDTLGLMARTLDDIALFRGAVLKLPPVAIDRGIAAPAHRLLPHADLGRGLGRHQGAARAPRPELADKGAVGGRYCLRAALRRHSRRSRCHLGLGGHAQLRRRTAAQSRQGQPRADGRLAEARPRDQPGALRRRPAQVGGLPRPCRFAVRQGRRAALPQRAGRGAGRASSSPAIRASTRSGPRPARPVLPCRPAPAPTACRSASSSSGCATRTTGCSPPPHGLRRICTEAYRHAPHQWRTTSGRPAPHRRFRPLPDRRASPAPVAAGRREPALARRPHEGGGAGAGDRRRRQRHRPQPQDRAAPADGLAHRHPAARRLARRRHGRDLRPRSGARAGRGSRHRASRRRRRLVGRRGGPLGRHDRLQELHRPHHRGRHRRRRAIATTAARCAMR